MALPARTGGEKPAMELVPGKQVAERISGMIQPRFQVHGYAIDLTVARVSTLDPTGQVDFSGGEYTPASKVLIEPRRRRTEDKYAWWELGRGCYFFEFNESLELAEDEIGFLEPDVRLLRAGASHVPMFLRGRAAPIEALVQVDAMRLQLKQNARISRLRLFRFAARQPVEGDLVVVSKKAKRPGKRKA